MVLFIFGSTGDLVKRKIVPAFVSLNPKDLEIVALGRKDFTDKMYEDFVCDDNCFRNFAIKPKYQKVEFGESVVCERCDEFLRKGEENYFYSALPPRQIINLLNYVGAIKRGGYRVSVLIEKPFGQDLKSALSLKEQIEKYDLEENVYIADHYLFKDKIRGLRPRSFKNLRVISLEEVGLERRIGYYEEIGALKDMVQSHFLNILSRLAPQLKPADIEVEKYIRGQYQNYEEELGRASQTETFVNVVQRAGESRIQFITGKAFDRKVGFVEIDGKKMEFASSTDDYSRLFLDFFANKKSSFSTVEQAISGWKITEKIETKKEPLLFYKKGTAAEEAVEGDRFLSKKKPVT